MPLELDHVNGDRFDNRVENLQVLCPNCHAAPRVSNSEEEYRSFKAGVEMSEFS